MDHSEVKHFSKVDHTPAELDEPSRLLLRVADYIEKNGHAKGCATSGTAVCIIGAMVRLHEDCSCDGSAADVACKRLEERLPGSCIPEWSDATPTDQMLAKLRAVAFGL